MFKIREKLPMIALGFSIITLIYIVSLAVRKTPLDPGEASCTKVCYPHGLMYRVGNKCKCDLSTEFRDMTDPHMVEQR